MSLSTTNNFNETSARKHPLEGLTIEAAVSSVGEPEESLERDEQDHESSASFASSVGGDSDQEIDFFQGGDRDSDNGCDGYNIESAIYAWDQIGELTHEITSSLMAKQASILCERFRKREQEESFSCHARPQQQKDSLPQHVAKKRKVIHKEVIADPTSHEEQQQAPLVRYDRGSKEEGAAATVVTCDEEDAASHATSVHDDQHRQAVLLDASAAVAPVSNSSTNNSSTTSTMVMSPSPLLSEDIYTQVDRIGRMSKLVLEIEYCQKELKKEMLAMREQIQNYQYQ